MKSNDDHTIMENLAHIIIYLVTRDQTCMIVKEAGLLLVLISLVDSSFKGIAKKAMSIIGYIANMGTDYCDLVLEAGILKPLLQIQYGWQVENCNLDFFAVLPWQVS